MSKQIVVFIDGTGNNGWADGSKQTNVFKLYQQVVKSTSPKSKSTVLYIRGIGTDPKPLTGMFSALQGWFKNKCDQGLGAGATKRLKLAYRFIARHYNAGDQIFLFGFSRGAFLAQILAGFMQRVGLLYRQPQRGYTVEQAFWLYWADQDGRLFANFLRELLPAAAGAEGIRTHFLGQWDAVESMDIVGLGASSEEWLREIAARERLKPLPHWIDHARHAVALHEVRQPFEPLLWSGLSRKESTLKQVWFAGAHADVGGGYASEDGAGTRYSDISLRWMWHQAKAMGLPLRTMPPKRAPSPLDVPHTPPSLLFGGRPPRVRPALAEFVKAPRLGEYLHNSVLKRIWQPIDDAYAVADRSMVYAWSDADEATIRLQYWLRFGVAAPSWIALSSLQMAVSELENFLCFQHILSDRALIEYASIALAFKAPMLDDFMYCTAYHTAIADRIAAVADTVRTSFVEPDVSMVRQDWKCQCSALHHLALKLKALNSPPAAPEEVRKI